MHDDSKPKLEFKLQFSVADDRETTRRIQQYADEYLNENDNRAKDALALDAGTSVKDGSYTKANFLTIYKWKLESFWNRNFSYIVEAKAADTGEVEDLLRLAVSARTTRATLAVLMGLPGTKLRVASAIATMIRPKRFTVLDVRALKALNASGSDNGSITFYIAYLKACTDLAERYGVTLRTLDRALFHWGGLKP